MQTVPTMKVTGSMINNMDLVLKVGLMVRDMKVNILKVKKKEMVDLHSRMVVFTKVSLNKMKSVASVTTIGLMVRLIQVTG